MSSSDGLSLSEFLDFRQREREEASRARHHTVTPADHNPNEHLKSKISDSRERQANDIRHFRESTNAAVDKFALDHNIKKPVASQRLAVGLSMRTPNKPSAYNAFLFTESLRSNEGKGTGSDRLMTLNDIAKEKNWKDVPQHEMEVMKAKMVEARERQKNRFNVSTKIQARDSAKTTDLIDSELAAMSNRCPCASLRITVKTDPSSTVIPSFHACARMREAIESVTGMHLEEFIAQIEAIAITGAKGVSKVPPWRQHRDQLKSRIRKALSESLKLVSDNKYTVTPWATYDTFRATRGFEIVGWPENLKIQALEQFVIVDLELIAQAIDEGSCKFACMSPVDVAAARQTVTPTKRKHRSDKGKTHKRQRVDADKENNTSPPPASTQSLPEPVPAVVSTTTVQPSM